jgi:hypothetical protein
VRISWIRAAVSATIPAAMSSPRIRTRVSPWRIAAALALLAAACDDHIGCVPVLRTEAGELELHETGAVAGACRRLREPGPLLVGTRLCPRLECGEDVAGCADADGEKIDSARVAACFSGAVSGPAALDGDCLVADGPGEITWTFTAQPCAARLDGYAPADDRLVLPAVDLVGVTAHLESPGDAFAVRSLVAADDGPLPEEPRLLPGEVAHVVADTEVPLAVVLRHPDHGQPVAWNPDAYTLEVETIAGADASVRFDALGVATIALPSASTARLALRRGDAVVPVGDVTGVAASDLVSLEIVAGFLPPREEGEGHGPPAGARAVLRTAEGTPVYGAEVEWAVEDGALPLWRDADRGWPADYVALADEEGRTCADPPKRTGTRRATVSAAFGDLSADVELSWSEPGEENPVLSQIAEFFGRDGDERSPHCEGPGFGSGCGCRTDDARGPGLSITLLLLAWAGFSRRTRRSGRRTSCSRPCA